MGNRAVITKAGARPDDLGIYLHWNGGVESVLAFCEAAKQLGVRSIAADDSYGTARLAQIIGNFFGGTLSLGIDKIAHLDCDNGDNGLYEVNGNWEIVKRRHTKRQNEPLAVAQLTTDEQERYAAILKEVLERNHEPFTRRE